jgi:mRNA-degrading endonuclease YafQ of YafQ-DinJ toxin-antitoxin module
MKFVYGASFSRSLKKLHPNQKEALDQALMVLIKNSAAGEEKRGDLVGIFVLKFRSNKVEWLLAYRILSKKEIALLVVGPHENFYRDLKNSI